MVLRAGHSGYLGRMAWPELPESARVHIELEVSGVNAARIDEVVTRPEFAGWTRGEWCVEIIRTALRYYVGDAPAGDGSQEAAARRSWTGAAPATPPPNQTATSPAPCRAAGQSRSSSQSPAGGRAPARAEAGSRPGKWPGPGQSGGRVPVRAGGRAGGATEVRPPGRRPRLRDGHLRRLRGDPLGLTRTGGPAGRSRGRLPWPAHTISIPAARLRAGVKRGSRRLVPLWQSRRGTGHGAAKRHGWGRHGTRSQRRGGHLRVYPGRHPADISR